MNKRRMITALLIGGATAGCTTSVSTAADELVEQIAISRNLICECTGLEGVPSAELPEACDAWQEQMYPPSVLRCERRVLSRYVESVPGSRECGVELFGEILGCIAMNGCEEEEMCRARPNFGTCFAERVDQFSDDFLACQERD